MLDFIRPHSLLRVGLVTYVSFAVLAIDQATKIAAISCLEVGESVFVNRFLNITLLYNPGISFGLFPAEGYGIYALIALTGLVVIGAFFWAIKAKTLFESVGLALIAGGGAGNVIDRALQGMVTDFLDFHWDAWHWPAFNVADIGVTLGVVFLVVQSFSKPFADREFVGGAVKIKNAWLRATSSPADVAPGYLEITNTGPEPDRLVGGSTEVASNFQIHQAALMSGDARTHEITVGVSIEPGQTVAFAPGKMHILLVGLERPLKEGDRIKGWLVFERAGPVAIQYTVEKTRGIPA